MRHLPGVLAAIMAAPCERVIAVQGVTGIRAPRYTATIASGAAELLVHLDCPAPSATQQMGIAASGQALMLSNAAGDNADKLHSAEAPALAYWIAALAHPRCAAPAAPESHR